MKPFELGLPQNIKETLTYLKKKNTFLKAGGIDLLDLMKEGILSPKRLVNIRNLKDLHFIKRNDRGLALGPNLTLGELAQEKELQGPYRAISQAAHSAATPQIQNCATLAGNLCQRSRCWYFRRAEFPCERKGGDTCYAEDGEHQNHAIFGNQEGCVMVHPSSMALALMALGASLKVVSARGEKEIPLNAFFVGPGEDITLENILLQGELITEIQLPKRDGWVSYYYGQKQKQSFDWPLAEVAVALQMEGQKCLEASIVLGAVAPLPWRAEGAQKALKNQRITKELALKIAEEEMKKATPLKNNKHKVQICKATLYRAICLAGGIDPFK